MLTDRDKRSTTPSPSPGIEETSQGTYIVQVYSTFVHVHEVYWLILVAMWLQA